jgi:AraC-like DNA-binding protein
MLYGAGMSKFDLSELKVTNDIGMVLAHSPASRSCLPVTVMPIAAEAEQSNHAYDAQRILVAHKATGHRWYQLGGKTRQLTTAPRMIEVYENGLTFDHCRWEGEAGHAVVVEFNAADLETVTHGEMHKLKLLTQHEVFDELVSGIALSLAEEALNGSPNGPLYAQGLCVSLIGVVANRYSSISGKSPVAVLKGQLGPLQKKRVLSLIRANLGIDLSLARMAQEVGLSTFHFARIFKATFGDTPHHFVQQRRVEAAVEALRSNPRVSIVEIALMLGFASQAHMTNLIRRRFGATPRALRL